MAILNKDSSHPEDASFTRAFIVALVASGYLSFTPNATAVVEKDSTPWLQSLESKNLFEVLNLPWTSADKDMITNAHHMQMCRLQQQYVNGQQPHFNERLGTAFATLINDFKRREHRNQMFTKQERQQLAQELFNLGKLHYLQGDMRRATHILKSATDLYPSMNEYARWLDKAEQFNASIKNKKPIRGNYNAN